MKNSYLARAKISEKKLRQVVRLFCDGLDGPQITRATGLNRNTVYRLLTHIRRQLAAHCESQSPLKGRVEIDESYFGPRRVRGKKGRGAARKIVVFGILKRQGQVYTRIVPNASREALKGVIEAKIDTNSTVYSDGWRSYDAPGRLGLQNPLPD